MLDTSVRGQLVKEQLSKGIVQERNSSVKEWFIKGIV